MAIATTEERLHLQILGWVTLITHCEDDGFTWITIKYDAPSGEEYIDSYEVNEIAYEDGEKGKCLTIFSEGEESQHVIVTW